MKHQTTKKLFALIIIMIMFSALPQFAGAQKGKLCPKGYKYECFSNDGTWGPRGTICICVLNDNGNQNGNNVILGQSLATNFELKNPSIVSIKIYDVTGGLIKTLAGRQMAKGEHQIIWDRKDAQGNAVSAGTYVLQLNAGGEIETRKLSVVH